MSDLTAPPSISTGPGFHQDASGRTWFCGPDGNWLPISSLAPPQHTPFEPASNVVGTGQSAQSFNFPPAFGGVTPSAAPHASSSAHSIPDHLIDPRLLPLPEDNDRDLLEPAMITHLRGLKPAPKVGGVRHKVKDSKGKKRQYSSDSDSDSDVGEPVPKRGRPKGSSNFSKDDTAKLLDLVEKYLPLGQNWISPLHS
ncbi:hypothetical protein C8R44DRAFT_744806 [Mycena epipterygia]|nr:hypothetical protein C8R44DRAFT_744806 [Mycena epipterygia]